MKEVKTYYNVEIPDEEIEYIYNYIINDQCAINWHTFCLGISGSQLYRSSVKIYKLAQSLLEYKWKLVVQIERIDL